MIKTKARAIITPLEQFKSIKSTTITTLKDLLKKLKGELIEAIKNSFEVCDLVSEGICNVDSKNFPLHLRKDMFARAHRAKLNFITSTGLTYAIVRILNEEPKLNPFTN